MDIKQFLVCFGLIMAMPSPSASRFSISKSEIGCDLRPIFPIESGGTIQPRSGDNGFNLKLEGMPEFYRPEQTYTVTLRSTYPVTFRGFALTAVHRNSSAPAGSFRILNPWLAKPMDSCVQVITHISAGKKSQLQFVWTAPRSGYGCVRIKASVIQKGTIWFQEDGDLSLDICEANDEETRAEEATCCSCGSAQYRLTFYGLWSPETHPKDYPTYSTHWSNIIGASHDKRYAVWDYGEYASDGVKRIAEWGWPNALENEIRGQGERVLSVIKTRAQWPAYQPRNLREPPSSVFDVDGTRHLVSFATMLGPSPDWNVGISKESLCTSECGWISSKTIDLTPWDAGTDSGVSYLSPNAPTNPQEKIRPLTSSDDPNSPFYDPSGQPIPPVAKVVLERLSISGPQCGESELFATSSPSGFDGDVDAADTPTQCTYGEWTDWSSCGVTCGWSIKVRSKSITNNLAETTDCQQTVMEKEICKGAAVCDNEEGTTGCFYSEWTSWSECTQSCGKGALRFRNRELKWPSEPANCQEPLKEMKFDCSTSPCPVANRPTDCEYSTWTDWMPCSTQCGVGKTLRKRFALRGDGCESPSMEFSKCMVSLDCSPPTGFDVPSECTYSPWTGWMPCPVRCGVGETFRKRVLASSAPNVHCKGVQMDRTKCMTSESCPDELMISQIRTCQYSEWTEWMPCSVTCSVGNTFRKRFLTSRVEALNCNEIDMESVKCFMPPCHIMDRRKNEGRRSNRTCMYGEWTAWMPCSVTCGRGTTLRKRFLQKSLDISRTCDGFVMETNQCSVPTSCSDETTSENAEVVFSPGSWNGWSHCSATCGEGQRSRTWSGPDRCSSRSNTSRDCASTQTEKCVTKKACPTDCVLSEWSPWASCSPCRSAEALGGPRTTRRKTVQLRTRKKITKPSRGGVRCGKKKERRPCACPGR